MYYKAEIICMSETFVNNDKNEGCDPDSMQDHGTIVTLTAPTLKELSGKMQAYGNGWEHFEENRYESGYEETERDGTHISVMLSAYITHVSETDLRDTELFSKLLKKAV